MHLHDDTLSGFDHAGYDDDDHGGWNKSFSLFPLFFLPLKT